MTQVRTCLWFDGVADEAARFYVSLIPGSALEGTHGGTPDGKPLLVNFHLAGTPYQGLNGGPRYTLSEAASVAVTTEDQAETDRLWAALTADGGREGRCGWCVDRFGLSWQVIPRQLPELLGGHDREGAGRATQAMFGMTKLELGALEAAYRGE